MSYQEGCVKAYMLPRVARMHTTNIATLAAVIAPDMALEGRLGTSYMAMG